MQYRFTKLALTLWLLLHSHISLVTAEAIAYEPVADNPAYKAVTELPNRPADHKISYGKDPNQYGLLWLGNESSKQETLVVFIHGGCWLSAFDISHSLAMTTALADAGFDVWSIEYRRTGETGGGWPTTFEDIKRAIAYLPELNTIITPPERVVIGGHSAGGHLALLAGADINNILPDTKVSIAGLAAITDISAYAASEGSCQSAGSAFMGGKPADKAEAYKLANPVNYATSVNTVLFQGKKDPIVPVSQAEALTKGTDITTRYVEAAGHFDWVHPGTPAFRKFLDYLTSLN